MPDFEFTSPDGRKIIVSGDAPPDKARLDAIFSKVRGGSTGGRLAFDSQGSGMGGGGSAGSSSEPDTFLSGVGRGLAAPFKMAYTGLTNPTETGRMVAGMFQSPARAFEPGLEPVERISNLLASVPVVGPASQQLGMRLGRPTQEDRPLTPQESGVQKGAAGEIVGGAALPFALKGAGALAEEVGSVRAASQARTAAMKAASTPTPENLVNKAIGLRATDLRDIGQDPAAELIKQKLDVAKIPKPEAYDVVQARIDELSKAAKQGVRASGDKPIAMGHQLWDVRNRWGFNDLIDNLRGEGGQIPPENLPLVHKLAKLQERPMEGPITAMRLDSMMEEIAKVARDKTTPGDVRAPLWQVWRGYRSFLPEDVQAARTSIHQLDPARRALARSIKQETVSPGPKAPAESLAPARRIIRGAPTIPGMPGNSALRMMKLLERLIPGSE